MGRSNEKIWRENAPCFLRSKCTYECKNEIAIEWLKANKIYLLNFRMLEWISSHQEDDPFVNPDHPQMKKANPWIEKKSCTIL